MSNPNCPVDGDLLHAVQSGQLEPTDAAIYTACRTIVKLADELQEVKKKLEAMPEPKQPGEVSRSAVSLFARGS